MPGIKRGKLGLWRGKRRMKTTEKGRVPLVMEARAMAEIVIIRKCLT